MGESTPFEGVSKEESIEKLCEGIPDAIYLLSGVTEVVDQDTGVKKYKPGPYSGVDWKGFMSGGKARALATVELSEHFPDAIVATNSTTFSLKDENAPTDAEVMGEFIEKKGVARERIIAQDRSTTTFTELVELVKYIAKYKWSHVVVVAGETQTPRTKEMLQRIDVLEDPAGAYKEEEFREALEYFKSEQPKITVISSEDILPLRDSKYKQIIEAARKTELWQTRQKLDEQAVNQLREGTYWKKPR